MSHRCPAAGCMFEVGSAQLACKRHWYKLPLELRTRIWRTYRSNDRQGHQDAVIEAVALLDPDRTRRELGGN